MVSLLKSWKKRLLKSIYFSRFCGVKGKGVGQGN